MHAKNPPAVSVVIPVHDVEPYLPALLQALDAQVLRDIEFILVNDGSQDRSGELCDQFAATRPHVTVVHHPQALGVSQARNAGLERATGRWLGFADADDIPAPELWSTLLQVAEADNLDLVLCNGDRFVDTPHHSAAPLYGKPKPSAMLTGEAWLAHCIEQDDYLVFVYLSLTRRALISDLGLRFLPGIVHEDILWMTQLLLNSRNIRYVDQQLYHWRHRIQSITQDASETMALQRIRGYGVVIQMLAQDAERLATDTSRNGIRWLAAKEGINLLGLLSRLHWRRKALMCRELEAMGLTRLIASLSPDWKIKRRLVRAWFWARLAALLPATGHSSPP